jgi:hypothetical protein
MLGAEHRPGSLYVLAQNVPSFAEVDENSKAAVICTDHFEVTAGKALSTNPAPNPARPVTVRRKILRRSAVIRPHALFCRNPGDQITWKWMKLVVRRETYQSSITICIRRVLLGANILNTTGILNGGIYREKLRCGIVTHCQ